MKISVITVNFNNKSGLEATIKSVIGQRFKDFEFIIIDGGSTDGSKEVIESYQSSIDYWVSERDKGVYNGMNKAIAVAKGEYSIFMNSGDCFYSETVLEKVFVNHPDADFIAGNYKDGEVLKKSPQTLTFNYMFETAICHQAVFIRTSLLKANPYNETYRIAADWAEMYDELILRNASYTYRDVIVASLQPNGISKKGWKELTADRDRHFKEVLPVRLYDSLKQDRIQKRMSAQQGELFEKILYLSSSPKMMAVVNTVVSHLYNFLVRRNKGK